MQFLAPVVRREVSQTPAREGSRRLRPRYREAQVRYLTHGAECSGRSVVNCRIPRRNSVHFPSLQIPKHFQSSNAQRELVEDLRPVLELLGPAELVEILRDDDGVARHDLLPVERSTLSFAHNRSIRLHEIDAA